MIPGKLLGPARCDVLKPLKRPEVHLLAHESGVEPEEIEEEQRRERAKSKTERASWMAHLLRPPIAKAVTAAAAPAMAIEQPKPTTSSIVG